ncbi:tetraspanin-4 isoform X1 [Tursiops truncatus]|uniref:tetraspanin-4 isoform X1 n=1 Tax=Tursiops truncatus TaxID=9739 RepID=UPI003CCF2F32
MEKTPRLKAPPPRVTWNLIAPALALLTAHLPPGQPSGAPGTAYLLPCRKPRAEALQHGARLPAGRQVPHVRLQPALLAGRLRHPRRRHLAGGHAGELRHPVLLLPVPVSRQPAYCHRHLCDGHRLCGLHRGHQGEQMPSAHSSASVQHVPDVPVGAWTPRSSGSSCCCCWCSCWRPPSPSSSSPTPTRNQDPGPLGWQHGAVWVVTGVRRHSPEGLCARPSPSIDRYAQRDLKKGLHLYGTPGNVGLTNAWSIIQTDFRCCGVSNYTDWFEVYNATRVPDSCCLEFSDSCGLHAPGTWWKAPCYETVKVWLQENLLAVGVFGLCTALVQILGLTFAMTMYCQVVKADTYCA